MQVLIVLIHIVYAVCLFGLAIYGFQAMWLSYHYIRRNHKPVPVPESGYTWPSVAVQLPIYNERHVAERVIKACTRLTYPPDKLEIQVLDDSDDMTAALVNRSVQEALNAGLSIRVIRRSVRSGFKAGALAHSMGECEADFVAIFDADFVPPEDFLLRTMPWFAVPGNESVGFVQSRWGHLNRDNSFLTRCQALALDGHFVVEQGGRQAAGFAFGFNGSGGVWRKTCIHDPAVGGWQADTLCEDLDLSYRAQLAGWNGIYVNSVESPAEIPPQLLAFKRQQFRWAKGSIQTLRKLGPRVWNSSWSIRKRLAASLHLGSYLIHPFLLGLLLVNLPLALAGADPAPAFALLSLASLGPPVLYALGQRNLYRGGWLRGFSQLPLLMLLGTGLCLSNTIAVAQGLFGKDTNFLRTPKFSVTDEFGGWRGSAYRLPLQPVLFLEAALAIYAFATSAIYALRGNYWTPVFLMIYALGFGLLAFLGLWQEWTARASMRRRRKHQVQEQRSPA